MSLFSENSFASSTPTHSSASSTFSGASTPLVPSRTKRSFILGVFYFKTPEWFHTNILCVVDPLGSVEADTMRLERLIVAIIRPPGGQVKGIQAFSLKGPQPTDRYDGPVRGRPTIFQATLEQLVEHLRECDMEPSSNPVRPNLWGTGKDTLFIQ